MSWTWHAAFMEENEKLFVVVIGNPEMST
jgi:hypothetical protein